MFTKAIFLATALCASLAAAGGNAIISNRCDHDVYIWSVDESHSSNAIKVGARSQYSEPLRSSCNGCGTSFKLSDSSTLSNGAHTQFEYSIVDSQVWYDISFVDCAKGQSADSCPGHAKGLAMDSPNKACAPIHCAAGTYCPEQAYYVDQPLIKLGIKEPVFTCPGAGTSMDIVMKVCADESSLKRSVAGRVLVDLD